MASESRPAKMQKSDRDFGTGNNSMVTLLVKDEEHGSNTFTIHEHLLCNASPFFKAALREEYPGEGEKTLCLRNVDQNTVNDVIPWLYSGRFPREMGELAPDRLYWSLVRLNNFAITYEVSGMTSESMTLIDELEERAQQMNGFILPGADHICEVYKNSPLENPLRKRLLALYSSHCSSTWFLNRNINAQYPEKCPDFVVDLVADLGRKLRDSKNKIRDSENKIYDLKEEISRLEDEKLEISNKLREKENLW